MTILVDMDDVLEGLADAWVKYLNKRHGTTVIYDDLKEWDVQKAFPTLSREEVYSPLCERGLWETVKPLPGAVEYMGRLMDDGHEIYIVTATNYHTVKDKMELVLFRYFPFLDWKHVIIAQNKQMIRGDVLIDDAPHNLENGEYFGILMTACHNREYDADAHGFARVNNWKEAYARIKKLERAILARNEADKTDASEGAINDNTLQYRMPEVWRSEEKA